MRRGNDRGRWSTTYDLHAEINRARVPGDDRVERTARRGRGSSSALPVGPGATIHTRTDRHTHTHTTSHVESVGSLQSDSRDIFTSLPLSSTSGGVSTKRHRVPVFFFHERVVGGTTEISAKIRPYRRVSPILCLRSSRCDDISVSRN